MDVVDRQRNSKANNVLGVPDTALAAADRWWQTWREWFCVTRSLPRVCPHAFLAIVPYLLGDNDRTSLLGG